MQSKYLQFGGHSFLLTAGTDGHIALWPLGRAYFEIIFDNDDDDDVRQSSRRAVRSINEQMKWNQRHHIHQSSIKCLTVLHVSSTDIIVGSGGDDNALAFTRITFNKLDSATPECATLLVPRAHASTITGIQCINHSGAMDTKTRKISFHLITVSNDQRLKSWTLNVNREKAGVDGFVVRKRRNTYSSIADASCMVVGSRQGDGDQVVIVAGIGLEVWRAEEF